MLGLAVQERRRHNLRFTGPYASCMSGQHLCLGIPVMHRMHTITLYLPAPRILCILCMTFRIRA
jgi:hypothetical protein